MTHRKCSICGEDVVLIPSAGERSRKTGESAQSFLDRFPAHAKCIIAKRSAGTLELIKRDNAK